MATELWCRTGAGKAWVGLLRLIAQIPDGSVPLLKLGETVGSVKASSGTISNAATLEIALPAGYSGFEVELVDLIPATDNVDLYCRVSTDGSSYDAAAGNYKWAYSRAYDTGAATGTTDTIGSNSSSAITMANGVGNGSSEGASLTVKIVGHDNSAVQPRIRFDGTVHFSSNEQIRVSGSGRRVNAQDTTNLRFLFSSGNIASGKWFVRALN